MRDPLCLSVAERLYGLSLIWQEANYNFAFFDRVPDLDWDASYREYIPRVISAEDSFAYYELLSRFTALLQDGHTAVIPPKSLYLGLDRPKLMLMNVGNTPIVTNACAGRKPHPSDRGAARFCVRSRFGTRSIVSKARLTGGASQSTMLGVHIGVR